MTTTTPTASDQNGRPRGPDAWNSPFELAAVPLLGLSRPPVRSRSSLCAPSEMFVDADGAAVVRWHGTGWPRWLVRA